MSSAMVLVCALQLLGRSLITLPPIELLLTPPPGVGAHVEAFVRAGSGIISLLTTSDVFEVARRGDCITGYEELAKIASIVVHEEWHVLHGADERGAYEAQLASLLRLGVRPDSALFLGVVRSMSVVLDGQDRGKRAVRRTRR